jgi:GTP-binding protein
MNESLPHEVALAGAAPEKAAVRSRGVVAIVGRPNVGKSTLFNRLIGRRQSIVHDTPGVTRDRVAGIWRLGDSESIDIVDTGGLVFGDDPIGISTQVLLAVEESDALIVVVDGREGLVAADEQVWDAVRRYGKPTVVAVNKGDTRAAQEGYTEFYSLGVEAVILISAEHGLGISDLADAVEGLVPPPEESTEAVESEAPPALAIVGRPNVGKSSLLNSLVGESRTLVSPIAGTTRDPIDSRLDRDGGRPLILVDTAGIRRRSQVSDQPEELAVMMARRQIERATVVALVVDAAAGITSGDLAIAGAIWEQGRPAVVVVNKWDLLDDEARAALELSWERLDEVLRKPPRVNVSAATRRGVHKVLEAVDQQLEKSRFTVSTADLNRLLEGLVARHQAPSKGGRPWRLYYATQVASLPPTFMLFANRRLDRTDSYRRYLENAMREAFELWGVPIRLVIKARTGKGPEKLRSQVPADGRKVAPGDDPADGSPSSDDPRGTGAD